MTNSTSDTQPADSDEPVDIGGISVKRSVLQEILPDVERFERHRDDALAIDAAMSGNEGTVPEYVNEWPHDRIEGVVTTLKELGSLREEAQRQIKANAESNDSDDSNERPVSQLFRHGAGSEE